jgi:hypothetical protein
MDIVELIASIVQVIAAFVPKDSPCPLCEAMGRDPVGTTVAIDAANAVADAAEKAKWPQ